MALKYRNNFEGNPPAGFDGEFLWDFLTPAWHREGAAVQIQPMDGDAFVERHGHLLMFETKDPGVPYQAGQMRTLDALVRIMPPLQLVLVFCCKRPEHIKSWWTWRRGPDGFEEIEHKGDSLGLVKWCRTWFEWADSRPVLPLSNDDIMRRGVVLSQVKRVEVPPPPVAPSQQVYLQRPSLSLREVRDASANDRPD